MSSTMLKDVFVVSSILGLIMIGLVLMLKSGLNSAIDREHSWRRLIDTITHTLLTVAGWGASLAAIQHVVGPRF